jgi:hypothetical protein
MSDSLRSPYPVQAVRPTCHWWLRPRVLAWFRVLMVLSLVKPPAPAGPLSRIGDYLFAARGPGLFLRIRRRTTFPPKSAVTRGPPHPLFHRRRATWDRRPGDVPRSPGHGGGGHPRRRRGSQGPRGAGVDVGLQAFCLGVPFVLEALCLGGLLSWRPCVLAVPLVLERPCVLGVLPCLGGSPGRLRRLT